MKKKKFAKQFAKAILLTQKIREESYDTKKAKKDKKKAKKKDPVNGTLMLDYGQYYTKDMMQSAEEACELLGLSKDLAYPIYLGMDWYNDMHDWAIRTLGKKHKKYLLKK